MDSDELVPLQPIDVPCPECDSDEGMPCAEPRFGQEGILIDFHDGRIDIAEATLVCPSCKSEDVATQTGYSDTVGDWGIDGCHDCGWVGQPH